MNCLQALAVAAAALATAGLPIEAQMAHLQRLIVNVEAESHTVLHAAADQFTAIDGEAPENTIAHVEFVHAPDSWIHAAARHPL